MKQWFKVILPVAFLALCVIGFGRLGVWQHTRMAEKQTQALAIQALQKMPAVMSEGLTPLFMHRRVALEGTYDHSREAVLENQPLGNDVGYRLLTPFLLANSQQEVLVDRGWVPRQLAATDFLAAYHDEGMQRISGIITPFPAFDHFWGGATVGVGPQGTTVLLRLDPQAVPLQSDYARVPVYVQADASRHPHIRAFVAPLPNGDKHREYMWTWFGLAVAVAGLGVLWVYRQLKKKS